MIRLEEAIALILENTIELSTEILALDNSLGRILAGNILSDMDMPPFDKSAMDGFACRKEDIARPLKILETIQAGQIPSVKIEKGTCARIMTGAPLPEGADCVIVVEKTELIDDLNVRYLEKQTAVNICYRGEDIRKGDLVLSKGKIIRPQEVAVLASAGYDKVPVFKQPRVGIAATGNELIPPGQELPSGSIRDSNSHQIQAQVEKLGIKALNAGIVNDNRESLRIAIKLLEKESDVIILSGGVSMGDFDLVPGELEKSGYKKVFHKVALKPGMPLWFGVKKDKYCFGLPGNPVSAFVQFEYLIKPFLYALMGCKFSQQQVRLRIDKDISKKISDRDSIIPVSVNGDKVSALNYHGSAHITAIPAADGFIKIPGETDLLKQGEYIDVRLI